MTLPGCADRFVKAVDWDRRGVTLTLDCGHRLWKGGNPRDPMLNFRPGLDIVQCQQSPCYQWQTYFGD